MIIENINKRRQAILDSIIQQKGITEDQLNQLKSLNEVEASKLNIQLAVSGLLGIALGFGISYLIIIAFS